MEAVNLDFSKKDSLKDKTIKTLGVNEKDAKLSLTYLSVSFVALLIGGIFVLIQGLERAGLLQLPTWLNYYEILTAHGVLLILVFTATFLVCYFYAGLSHTLRGLIPVLR